MIRYNFKYLMDFILAMCKYAATSSYLANWQITWNDFDYDLWLLTWMRVRNVFLSHFESFYFLVKSRSYYDYFWREKFRGQKVFLSPKFGFFIPEKHFLSPKFFPPKIIMFLAVRRRNKGRFCFDVTMEESDIIDIN